MLRHQHDDSATESIIKQLRVDLLSFFHEYVGMFWKKRYAYDQYGIESVYPETMSAVGRRFEQKLKAEKKPVIRAALDTRSMEQFEAWSTDESVPLGSYLLLVSPKGSVDEGYAGTNRRNYNFINLYQKVGSDEYQLIQYTNFDHFVDLKKVLIDISQLSTSLHFTLEDFVPSIGKLSLRHSLVTTRIELSPLTDISSIENCLYQFEHRWKLQRTQLPKIDDAAFTHQLRRLVDFAIEEIISCSRGENAVERADLLIKTIREVFLKWVETHAENYQNKDVRPTQFQEISLNEIRQRWRLEVKKAELTINKNELVDLSNQLSSTALSPLIPLLRLSTIAHCVAGTPHSLAFQIIKTQAQYGKLLQAPTLFGVGTAEINYSRQNKEPLTNFVKKQLFGQIWFIRREFASAYTEETCRLIDGIVIGPCDIPLREDRAHCISESVVTALAYGSSYERSSLNEAIKAAEAIRLRNPQEQQYVDFLLYLLSSSLRKTVSLIQLLNSDYFSWASLAAFSCMQKLSDPFQLLKNPEKIPSIVADLLRNNDFLQLFREFKRGEASNQVLGAHI